MKKYIQFIIFTVSLNLIFADLQSQNKIPFGDIKIEDLENKPYKPDPGADAIIISDKGIASLNYDGNFYIELVRDVKIRIVNSKGFDYANIELPFSANDKIFSVRASTFNKKDGQITETVIPKKSFITDNSSRYRKTLKFNFPDVHEGSVIEYSYTVRMEDYALYILVPWEFQSDIPVVSSILTVVYPEYFTYKSIISGSSGSVNTALETSQDFFASKRVVIHVNTWYVSDMPAFLDEPFIKSREEHLTKINFELASTNFPGSSYEEITPSYSTLTEKLLERTDFGRALESTLFLKKKALELTQGLTDDLSKLKKIHEYVSEFMLWNGVEDYSTSGSLRTTYYKEKGNSADINFILISMLRAVNVKADPLILSTRSNGSINQYSAMIQQFNYVVAYVNAGNKYYLVDATDPLRPFNVLPFDCLNGVGRLIIEFNSEFIDLKNNEKDASSTTVDLYIDDIGNIEGELKSRYSDYNAYAVRKLIKLEGEDGYLDLMKDAATEVKITGFKLQNIDLRDSDVIETVRIKVFDGTQIAGDKIIFNPFLSPVAEKNSFYQETRNFPIDFGTPIEEKLVLNIRIPDGFSYYETPANVNLNLGNRDGSYSFTCIKNGNNLIINSILKINKTTFQPSEYLAIQDFYSKVLKKQAEMIVLKKDM